MSGLPPVPGPGAVPAPVAVPVPIGQAAGGLGVGGLGITRTLLRLLAFLAVAAVAGGAVAAVYRWYARRRVPLGPALLFGIGVVAVYLNTVGLYGDVLAGGEGSLFTPAVILFNVGSLAIGGVGAAVGRTVGDRLATDAFVALGARELDAEPGRLVRSVGRVAAVELPAEIEDMAGYDPVSPEVKADLAGRTLLVPRRLSGAERRDRLVTRLKEDHDVAHVDVELGPDGAVEYLAVGARVAGVGPTLAPGTVACTVRADPAAGASPGDVVQVWRSAPEPERVLTGELRATGPDAATVAVDAAEATALDASTAYRLLTLPAEPRADREFAAALRAADETMGVVAVAAGSPLDGRTVADADATVVAVGPADGAIEAIPPRDRTLVPGDTLYVVARPEELRRLEARTSTPAGDGGTGATGGSGGGEGDGDDRADAQPS
ncbi:MAG: TrkA C-terminal domain-containing protein [Haloferacaceae archaeon]